MSLPLEPLPPAEPLPPVPLLFEPPQPTLRTRNKESVNRMCASVWKAHL
jgi:hypothetical protein